MRTTAGEEARVRLLKRPGQEQVTTRHRREDLPFLLVAAVKLERQRRDRRAVERDGRDRAADFFEDDAQIRERQPLTAVLLRERDTKPAQLGHLPPQLGRISQLVLLHRAGEAGRTLGLEEVSGRVPNHLLFFAQQHIHDAAPARLLS